MTTFQGIDGITETRNLVLLSKQRRTITPLDGFDISQFKLAVGKDVSAHIIEKLQKQFGHDIAGGTFDPWIARSVRDDFHANTCLDSN